MDANTPPNFNGHYPLDGAKVGPAWRSAWRLLVDASPEPVESGLLVAVMRRAANIEDKTARNLLAGARRARLLAVTYDGPRRSARYRPIDSDTVLVDRPAHLNPGDGS